MNESQKPKSSRKPKPEASPDEARNPAESRASRASPAPPGEPASGRLSSSRCSRDASAGRPPWPALGTPCGGAWTEPTQALAVLGFPRISKFLLGFVQGFYKETCVLGGPGMSPGGPRKHQEVLSDQVSFLRSYQEVLGGPRCDRRKSLGGPSWILGGPRSS